MTDDGMYEKRTNICGKKEFHHNTYVLFNSDVSQNVDSLLNHAIQGLWNYWNGTNERVNNITVSGYINMPFGLIFGTIVNTLVKYDDMGY